MRLEISTIALCALAACALPANAGLIITPTFDPNITTDSNAAAIEGAINTAILTLESSFANNIDVPIYFQEGGGLGGSNVLIYSGTGTYGLVYNQLISNNANPDSLASLNANGGNANTNGDVNPVTGTSRIEIKSANARALGINVPAGCYLNGTQGSYSCSGANQGNGGPFDGIITLNTSLTSPGSPGSSGSYNLAAVAEHEIDEILGLGSALENTVQSSGIVNASNDTPYNAPTIEDLFRYDALGNRTLNTNCASPTTANFSYGPATGAITGFNNACNGADFGDWAGTGTPQVQDAFATPGAALTLGTSEMDALTAIGYVANPTPEPALFAPLLLSLGLILFRARATRA
ncbi:MAG TPA: NF038122 family metalloprotease [Bryobacteraceae bacterium]|jgi:hypothetical protein